MILPIIILGSIINPIIIKTPGIMSCQFPKFWIGKNNTNNPPKFIDIPAKTVKTTVWYTSGPLFRN